LISTYFLILSQEIIKKKKKKKKKKIDEIENLFSSCGFETINNDYVIRETVNRKEGISLERIFVQGKFKKISNN